MARKASPVFDERTLTKGHLRKLNALRKSLGDEIADKAFGAWLERHDASGGEADDKDAVLIAETLAPLATRGKLKIPRGGYLVRRGRGRVIVERARSD